MDLPICSPKFEVLLPQFNCCVVESSEITKIVMLSIPTGLKNAGIFLSASLIFHLDELESYLHSSHPLLHSSFLTSGKLIEMRKTFVLKCAWEEEYDGVDKVEDRSCSSVAVVSGLLGDDDELTSHSFNDLSLVSNKPMSL